MADRKAFEPGDPVTWITPQGPTSGRVVRKVTATGSAGGHVAKADEAEPEYRVKSDKSGKEAIHRPEALSERRG